MFSSVMDFDASVHMEFVLCVLLPV